jgi:hypothetical protein
VTPTKPIPNRETPSMENMNGRFTMSPSDGIDLQAPARPKKTKYEQGRRIPRIPRQDDVPNRELQLRSFGVNSRE